METKALVLRHWDDVVFENRNKAYGAYSLRRAYSDRIFLGLGITLAFIMLIFFYPFSQKQQTVAEIPPLKPWTKEREVLFIQPQPPAKERKVKVQKSNTTKSVVVTKEQVVEPVKKDEVKTDIVTVTDGVQDGVITDDLFVDGTSTGTGDVPAVVEGPKIVNIAEVMPSYVGGMQSMMKFIQKKMHYPAAARRMGIEGTVYVSFVVSGEGLISDVQVIRGIFKDCDEEAMRVISLMPPWTGGKQNGMPVPVRMVLPIKFKLK